MSKNINTYIKKIQKREKKEMIYFENAQVAAILPKIIAIDQCIRSWHKLGNNFLYFFGDTLRCLRPQRFVQLFCNGFCGRYSRHFLDDWQNHDVCHNTHERTNGRCEMHSTRFTCPLEKRMILKIMTVRLDCRITSIWVNWQVYLQRLKAQPQ